MGNYSTRSDNNVLRVDDHEMLVERMVRHLVDAFNATDMSVGLGSKIALPDCSRDRDLPLVTETRSKIDYATLKMPALARADRERS